MYNFGKRPIVEEAQKVSAGNCVRNYLLGDTGSGKPIIDLNDEDSVKSLIENIELGARINLTKEVNGKVETTEPNRVRLTYTKSNLGKGFIFWFLCNLCGRRVRYLYIPSNTHILACRVCHRLSYDKQNENKRFRDLSKFLVAQA